MPHLLYLVPSGGSVGLTSVALGVVRALDRRGIRVAFFKPIGQAVSRDRGPERSTYFVRRTSSLAPVNPIPLEEAERRQLTMRYGHFAFTRNGAMDHFFTLYRQTGQGRTLRDWMVNVYPALFAKLPAGQKSGPPEPGELQTATAR